MERRKFLKYAAALSLSPVVLQYLNDWTTPKVPFDFEIEVLSDVGVGHILRESQQYPQGSTEETEYLVVGGGIAGLAAAYGLRKEDFYLCELSNYLGGSSSAEAHKDQHFAQGAHYDLAYPEYYGKEVLQVLRDLNVIDYNYGNKTWEFVDKHYLIPAKQESISYTKDGFRADVLPQGKQYEAFKELLRPYIGAMPLPTRLIKAAHHPLNQLSFADFLKQHITLDAEFLAAIDYAMLDDWGGTASQVSALAGIHYYTCRPYFEVEPELFSPPEGNAYFAQKLIGALPNDRLKTNQLVREIKRNEQGYAVTLVDVKQQQQWVLNVKNIVYAGHKYALKYIYPPAYQRFQATTYAPWLCVNIVLKERTTKTVFWQNEYLAGDSNFMGFVDSAAQFQPTSTFRTLTAYYCLPPDKRKELLDIHKNASALVNQTITYMETMLKTSLSSKIAKAFIKVMGHAMPIPVPNYLLTNPNSDTLETGIAFAGVDTGRLPLFFEAADSGLMAAERLLERKYGKV